MVKKISCRAISSDPFREDYSAKQANNSTHEITNDLTARLNPKIITILDGNSPILNINSPIGQNLDCYA